MSECPEVLNVVLCGASTQNCNARPVKTISSLLHVMAGEQGRLKTFFLS